MKRIEDKLQQITTKFTEGYEHMSPTMMCNDPDTERVLATGADPKKLCEITRKIITPVIGELSDGQQHEVLNAVLAAELVHPTFASLRHFMEKNINKILNPKGDEGAMQ